MNDQEYLAKAGITDAETGTPANQEVTASQPAEGAAATADQKAVEMFEIAGNKFPTNTEFQILHNGKYEKVPYSNLANSWRQASHYNEKYNQLKKEWEPKIGEYDKYKGFFDKYSGIQEWSENNPQEWNTLWQMYQDRNKHLLAAQSGQVAPEAAAGNPNLQPFIEKISKLEQTIEKLSGVASKYETYEQQRQEAQDTTFIKDQISKFGEEFKEIDLNEKDPEGVSLWAKIIQWGLANGYQEFTPAAHMFLKDRIAETYSSRARNEAMKGVKTDHMNGIVKRSATPIMSGQTQGAQTPNARNLSYGKLAEMAKAAMGQ